MRARFRQPVEDIDGSFRLRPSLVVIGGILFAELLINMPKFPAIPGIYPIKSVPGWN
jgi:hypothetical protein